MQPNLRAERFAILKALAECHECRAETPVSALMVPAFEEFDGEEWTRLETSALLIYVEAVDAATRQVWSDRAPSMLPVASKTAGLTYLANVCRCGALQGDFYLTKPDAPFFPLDDAGTEKIRVEWIEAPLKAIAGTSESSWVDRLIERSPFPGWTAPTPPKPRGKRGCR